MVSNALSSRRRYLRRPKVCKASPNPGRCHVPPPPPPPFWGPPTIHISGWVMFSGDGGAFCWGSWIADIPADEATQTYFCIDLPSDVSALKLTLYVCTADPEILLVTYAISDPPCSASAYRDDVPYEREPPDFLTISTWYDLVPDFSELILTLQF